MLANIAATVVIISGGRLIIGLGAGWNQEESDALGIRLPRLKERTDQFEEGVQVVIELLSQPKVNFHGHHFTLTDAWCEPKPVQRPHPPIAISGNGERRTLRVVAPDAQHWKSTLGDVAEWQRKCGVLGGPPRGRRTRPVGDREVDQPSSVGGAGPAIAATDDRAVARRRFAAIDLDHPLRARMASTDAAIALADRGVRSSVVRLPPTRAR